MLLAGAGLLVRSLVARLLIDQGFDPREALVLQISLPPARYPTPADRQAFHERLLRELQQLPGATAAGLAVTLPNQQGTGRFAFDPHGIPGPDPLTMQVAPVRTVSDGFFEAMGMRLLAGRTFRSDDHQGAEPVMVISESLSRRHFPDGDAVGRLLYSGTGTRRVIGVVGDVRPAVPDLEQEPSAYLTMRQHRGDFRWFAGMNLVIRGSRPERFESPLRTLLLSLDDRLPPFNVRLLSRDVARLVAAPRFAATVLVAFAVVAIVLAAVGVYGVMAFGAAHRTREIAVRMALGATTAQARRLVLRDGARVVAGGLAIGLPAAAWTARGFTGLLYDVQPADPLTLGLVAVGLSMVGLGAAYIPARRATRQLQVAALKAD
jgi:predicted permease